MMVKLAWRSVREHPVRFGMSVIVVVLGVAFVTGTFSLRSMMSSTFSDIVDSAYVAQSYVRGVENPDLQQSADSFGVDPDAGRVQVPVALADELADVPGVDMVIPDVGGSLVLVKADGTAMQTNQAPTLAFGLVPEDPTLSVAAGTLPQNDHEIALEKSTLERSGLSVGSTTTIVLSGAPMEVTVVGELRFAAATSGASLVGLNMDTAMAAFAPDGNVGSLEIFGQDGYTEQQIAANVADVLTAPNVEVVTGDELREETTAQIETMLGFVSTFLLIFALVALVVGGFIIANTFAMVVRQRLREIAVLRAVGAAPRQVFASVVGQAAIVGLIGSLLGIGGGLGLVYLLRAGMAAMGMEMSGAIPLEAGTVIIGIVTGVVVCVVSAAIPARQASRVPPVDAMRETVSIKEKQLRLRGILGGVLVVGGVAAVIAAMRVDSDGGPLLGLGAAGLLVGMLVWAPAVTRPVIRTLAWPLARWGRPVGPVAVGNVIRNPRRTASTSGALMIGMALVGAAAVLAASAQATLISVIDKSLDADFVVQSVDYTNGMPVQAAQEIAETEGVAAADGMWSTSVQIDDSMSFIGAVPPSLFDGGVKAEITAGDIADFGDGTVLVQHSLAESKGWQVGDTVDLKLVGTDGAATTAALQIAATVKLDALGVPLMTTQQWYEANVPQVAQRMDVLFVQVAEGSDPEQVRDAMAEVVKPYVVISIMDQDEFNTEMSNQVNQLLLVLYALLALSIVIAVLGIVNTLALSIMERTKEIGLLRAVGMSKLQLSSVVVTESILIAVFGAVGGLAVGVGVAAALPTVFEADGFDQLAVPWLQLGTMVGIAAVVGLVAALWPAIRASRLPVLDALAYE